MSSALTQKVARGVLGAGASIVVSKLAALLSQVCLGWWLAKDDFATFGIAMSTAAMLASIKGGGVEKVLIRRGEQYSEIVRSAKVLGFGFALSVLVAMSISAWPLSRIYQNSDLAWVFTLLGVNFLFQVAAAIRRARVQYEMKFSALAVVASAIAVLKSVIAIALAFGGLGVGALVWPLLVTSIAEWLCYVPLTGGFSRKVQGQSPVSWVRIKSMFRESKWVVASGGVAALIQNGDFIVVGYWAKHLMAGYFFGFQLLTSVTSLFTSSFQAVLIPSFVRLEEERKAGAYVRCLKSMCLATLPAFLLVATISPYVIRFVWGGKWDESAVVVVAFATVMPVRILSVVSTAVMESGGYWITKFLMQLIDGIGMCTLAYVLLVYGEFGMGGIAWGMSIYRLIFSLIQVVYVGSLLKISINSYVWLFWITGFVFGMFGLSNFAQGYIAPQGTFFAGALLSSIVVLAITLAFEFVFYRNDMNWILRILLKEGGRKR